MGRRGNRIGGALCLAAVLMLGAGPAAWGQVNTERFRGAAGEDGRSASVELSFANRTGNTDLLEGGAAVRLGWRKGPRTVLAIGDVSVGKARDATTINRGFAHLRGGRALTARVAWEGFVQHEYDKFARLDARTLVGTGPRFTLFRAASADGHLGVAYMFERERLRPVAGAPEPRTAEVHRVSSYLALGVRLDDRLSLVNTVYVQPRVDRVHDLRVLEEASLQVGLAGPLSLKVSFSVRYDGEPPTGVKDLDTALSNRLVWEF